MVIEINGITISDEEETEFYVKKPLKFASKGLYLKVKEIYEIEEQRHIALATTGRGPEIDLPIEKLENLLSKEKITPKEHDSEMHD